MKTYKLTKWGAQRLLSYYLDIYDWGTTLYNEEKYTPLLKEVLQKTMKTGQLEIPEKYPGIKNILEQDMRSGLEMDEMNVDEISSWATHPYRNSRWKQ